MLEPGCLHVKLWVSSGSVKGCLVLDGFVRFQVWVFGSLRFGISLFRWLSMGFSKAVLAFRGSRTRGFFIRLTPF